MITEAITATIIDIVADTVHRDAAHAAHPPITADTRLDGLALDSLGCIELTAAVEDEFDVAIDCGERISFETVGCIVALVEDRLCRPVAIAA